MATTPTPLQTARRLWAASQTLSVPLRWKAEGLAWNVFLRGLSPQDRAEFRRHEEPHLAELILSGPPIDGWAFAYGFSVHWFPSQGVAKHQRYVAWKGDPHATSPMVRCTDLEAYCWERQIALPTLD